MEETKLKVGDQVIILEGPKLFDEWVSPNGKHIVEQLTSNGGYLPTSARPYFFIRAPYSFRPSMAGKLISFDARRAVKVEDLTLLEQAIYL